MSFLKELFAKPDDFRGQPYAYLTNQVGHIFLGGALPMFWIFGIVKTIDVYPSQDWVVAFTVLGYLILWELIIQGWRGWDTCFDTIFFGIGSSLYLFVEMDVVLDRMMVWLTLIAAFLFITTYRQYRIGKNERRP